MRIPQLSVRKGSSLVPRERQPPRVFRAFTVKHTGIISRIITEISLSKAYDPANPPRQPYPLHNTRALWDTGATKSVITKASVEVLNLVSVGRASVFHAGGSSETNTYLVNIILPNKVEVVGALVTEAPNIVGDFGAIIGMDIISQGALSITNANGETWMTFCMPSIKHIDYVVDVNRILFAGTGRNDPCPCGKKDSHGNPIKFKQCHGKGR